LKTNTSNIPSSVRTAPAIALESPSYKGTAVHAAAALHHLSEQYSLKRKTTKKAGHA
jgi:hypothetical protein